MSVTAFFERFMGLQQQKVQATVASYRELVAGIATGEEPNPAEVERLLSCAGKSADDLRLDVERYQHRMALKAMVDSLPKLEAERREIDEPIVAADRVLEAAEKQHDETTAPLYASRRELDLAIADASRASTELMQSCDDADLRRELDELNTEARRLDEQYRNQTDRATYMEEKARSENQRAERELTLGDTEARREVAERYGKEADSARRNVKRLEKAQADLAKRREQIEQRMRQA
jgi:hypothetical protein